MSKIDELHEHFENLKKDEEYINFFNSFALENLRSKPEYMKEALEKVVEISKECNYRMAYAYGMLYIGWYYHDRSDYNNALEYHMETNAIFNEIQCIDGIILSYNALLADYTKIGYLDLAIESGIKGIEIAEKHTKREGFMSISINTMVSYMECGYYEEALKLSQTLNNLPYEINVYAKLVIYTTMAEIYLKNGDIEIAEKNSKLAYELAEQTDSNLHRAEVLIIIGQIHFEKEQHEEAKKCFERAMEISVKIRDISTIIKLLISWGKCHGKIGDYESGEKKLKEALKYAEESNSQISLRDIYLELSIIYKCDKKFEEAYNAQEKYIKVKEKTFSNGSKYWFKELKSRSIVQQAIVYKELYSQIDVISKIGKKLTSDLRMENILRTIHDEINKLVNAEVVGIALYDEIEEGLDYKLFVDKGERVELGTIKINENSSFGVYCFNNKEFIRINDASTEYKQYLQKIRTGRNRDKSESSQSLIFSPLIVEERCIGIFTVQCYEKNAYNINDLNTVKTLSSYIAIAIENALLFDEVEYMATHDNLTGLLSRTEILKIGEEKFQGLKLGDNLSIIIMDIDYFKRINDTYGHGTGDYILKEIANNIKLSVRKHDLIARYGGEEFLIILPNTSKKEAYNIAERIRKKIDECKYDYQKAKCIKITSSLGVYKFDDRVNSFYEGINLADIALYKAKDYGRNITICYKEK